jgi:hypothetical protein
VTWHHLLVDDLWTPVWPNLAASGFLGPMVWLKLRAIHKLHQAHFDWHKEQKGDHDA